MSKGWIEEVGLILDENEALRKKLNGHQEHTSPSKKCVECRDAKKRIKKFEIEASNLSAKLAELQAECEKLEKLAEDARDQLVAESSAREEAQERAEAAEAKLRHFAQETGEISVQ